MNRKLLFGRLMILLGMTAGFISVWHTVAFTWTPEFQAMNLPAGPTHSNYHAFRGAILSFPVNLLLIWVAIQGLKITQES